MPTGRMMDSVRCPTSRPSEASATCALSMKKLKYLKKNRIARLVTRLSCMKMRAVARFGASAMRRPQ
ncbi:hypothetical protein D3C72_2325170 [compost metagenome]